MTDLREYDTLVVGASMTALGLAMARPRDVIVIERRATPAPEFVGALCAGNGRPEAASTPAGAELRRELENRGILRDARYHLPALAAVYCRLVREHSLKHLFWTEVLDVLPCSGGYTVGIFNASGAQRISVRRIVDTSPEPVCAPAALPRRTGREFRALVHGVVEPGSESIAAGEIIWEPGLFESEHIFGVRLPRDAGLPEARTRLLNAWRARPSCASAARIAALATDFRYLCSARAFGIGKDWTHFPAAGCSNPIAAYEAGSALENRR